MTGFDTIIPIQNILFRDIEGTYPSRDIGGENLPIVFWLERRIVRDTVTRHKNRPFSLTGPWQRHLLIYTNHIITFTRTLFIVFYSLADQLFIGLVYK